MEWQPIETAPEDTYILVWKDYLDENERIAIDRFKWVTREEEVFVRETGNGERVYRTDKRREREWEVSGAEWWMPVPAPPPGL
jgi:hypothetical protein